MKIAIVTNFFPPILTGSSVWAMGLVRAHSKAGDEVIVVTVGKGESVEIEETEGVKIYRLPLVWRLPRLDFFMNFDSFFLMNNAGNRRRLEGILRDHRIEIVHQSNQILDSLFMVRAVCARLDLPWIATAHGAITHSGNRLYAAIMETADRLVIKRQMDACEAIVSLDVEMSRYVESTYSPRRSVVIPQCCMDTAFFLECPVAQPEQYAGSSTFSIASVGHVTDNRDRTDLIHALADLQNVGIDVHLDVIGRVLTSAPVDLSQRLGVANQIDFHSELSRRELLQRLAKAHVEAHLFFMPGLGLATQEAMAVGLPTVSHGYEGIYGDVPLRHGENVFFADPKKPQELSKILRDLALDPELRKSVGHNARQLVGEYLVWDVILKRFQSLCTEVI